MIITQHHRCASTALFRQQTYKTFHFLPEEEEKVTQGTRNCFQTFHAVSVRQPENVLAKLWPNVFVLKNILKFETLDMRQAAVKMGNNQILFPGGTRHINILSTFNAFEKNEWTLFKIRHFLFCCRNPLIGTWKRGILMKKSHGWWMGSRCVPGDPDPEDVGEENSLV